MRARRLLPARLLLALASFLVAALLLEGMTRLFVRPPSPVQLRDGIYVTQLAKVNGRVTVLGARGESLPEKKKDGEIRIFVFGESSIQGSPWDYFGSPPTLLYDQLRAVVPDKNVTVVNMGRGAGYMIDSYYFLVSIMRFAPDYVVIYQGGNDEYRTDAEMCLPATHPTLYRGWRWLVERSRLLWTIRAEGPAAFTQATQQNSGPKRGTKNLCDDVAAFRGWADILIETGQAAGARVIVTTPVQNPLRWAEEGDASAGIDMALHPADKPDSYRQLLACKLTDGCDIATKWSEVQASKPTGAYVPDYWVRPRTAVMLKSAADHGVRAIDFFSYLQKNAAGGLSPALFSDEVHLSQEGYWHLAWQWTSLIGPDLGSRPLPELPPPIDRQHYLHDILSHGIGEGPGPACLLLPWANLYLRVNMALIAANLLEQAVALDTLDRAAGGPSALPSTRAGVEATLLIGWMRQLDGLDPQLPPSLADRLRDVSIADLTKELNDHRDCTTVGGPLLPVPETQNEVGAPGSRAIPKAEESIIAGMLGAAGAASGCALQGAAIEKSFVHATYVCAGGRPAAIELHHSSDAPAAVATTEKFALVASNPPPPPELVQALSAEVRKMEGVFRWERVARGDSGPTANVSGQQARSGVRWWPIAMVLGLLSGGVLIVLRKRRRMNITDPPP